MIDLLFMAQDKWIPSDAFVAETYLMQTEKDIDTEEKRARRDRGWSSVFKWIGFIDLAFFAYDLATLASGNHIPSRFFSGRTEGLEPVFDLFSSGLAFSVAGIAEDRSKYHKAQKATYTAIANGFRSSLLAGKK